MAENLQITADVYANTQPAARQIKAFSDKNLNNLRLNLAVNDSGLKKGSTGLGQIRNDADQFTKSMAAANARVLAFGTAVAVIETMRRSFLALIKTTVDVEQALTKISVVAGDDLAKAGVSISQLGKSIFNIARDTGQSFETVNEATLEFQRQGIGVQESLKRTRDAMIAVRISGVSVGDAVTGLTSILNAFKKSGLDSTTALNKLVALDNSSAASLPDLFQGLQRAASVSQLAGNNFNQTAASIATLQEITARGGPVIGNALKSIDTRLYGEKSLKFLSEFQGGIVKVKDEAGQLLPSIEIIRNLSGALKTLPKGEQLGVLTELSGLYQVNSLSALVDSFQLVDGEISLYDKNLKTVTNASNEASVANKKLSTILASQFNTVNVNVGEFLNKLGEIGVKNPLSGVLNFLIKIQGTLQNILEGSGPLDSLIQGVIKFSGGALFSTPVIAGGAFILVKIIKDFITFATTAFSVFTGINSKLKEESSILSTVGTKLKSNVDSVNSISNAEQRRLSLTKSATAEYAKQLALTNGISASLGTKALTTPRFLFGDNVSDYTSGKTSTTTKAPEVPKLSTSGIVASAVVARASYPSPSGYAPPSGLNIAGSLRNRSGQFVDQNAINTAVQLMVKDLIATGKSGNNFSAVINKTIGTFELNKESFIKASRAANLYASSLLQARNQLAQNLPRPSFVNQPSFLRKESDLGYARGLAFQRSSNPSSVPTDLFNVEAGKRASANIAERERRPGIGAFGYGGNQYQVAPLSAAAQKIPLSTGGFNPEAFKNFAFNAVLATAAIEGLTSTFRGISPGLDRFADLLSKASFALAGIIALNQVGGLNLGGLLGKTSGLGNLVGSGSGAISGVLSGVANAGKGLLRILPVVGQVAIGLTVLNEAVRAITGTSVIERLSLSLGGLTDGASKAKDRFNEIAKELFDPKGNYSARSLTDRQSSLTSTRQEAIQKITAQKQGIKIDGKNPQEIAIESFRKLLADSVANIETGGLINDLSLGNTEGPRQAVISDLSNSAKEYLYSTLQDITSGTLEELKANAVAVGITKIGDVDTANASREQISAAIAKAYTEQLIKAYSSKDTGFGKNTNFDKLIQDPLGAARLSGFALNFISKGAPKSGELPNLGVSAEKANPESQKKFFDYQKDLLDSIYNGASAQIEAEIKSLDTKTNDSTLTQNARRELEKQRDILARQALDAGNLSANAQFKNSKQLIQSQLGVNGKTQEEVDRDLFILERNLKNTNTQYQESIKLLNQETNARDKANSSLDRLTRATDSAQATLSNLSVARAISNQRISGLESASNNPTLDIFGRESFQRQANQEKINALRTNAVDEANAQAELKRAPIKDLPLDKQDAANKEINKALEEQLINIQTNINELESANQNIGAVSSASAELTTSLEEFRRNIGQSRAQNDFNTLQATDSSSLVSGLISKQVFSQAEGKSGQELVSFLADQNTILNEQFKIKTAASATEKLDLETQLALTKEILDIKTQELDPLEKQQKIEEAINKNLALRRSFGFGVSQAQAGIQSEIQTFNSDFGKTATNGFRDALVGAMQAAVTKTEDLKSALLNVALTFANKLRDAALENLANIIVNSGSKQGGGSSGGLISSVIGGIAGLFSSGSSVQKKAAGGMISGGSGTKDDVPTLLMGGEYVIPKSTVRQYGVGFFESLRNGSVGKMAQGGYFEPGTRGQGAISGNQNLLDFATQTATSGAGDVTRSLGGGAAIAALEPESLRLSNFARFGDSPIVQSTQEAKNQAFGLYLDGLNSEKEYAAQQEAIKKAKKDQINGLWTALAVAVIGGAISYGANTYGSSAKKTASTSTGGNTQRYYDGAGKLTTSAASSLSSSQNYAPAATSRDGYYNPYPSQTTLPLNTSTLPATRGIYSGGYNNPLFNGINVNGQYHNAGGYVGGNGDTVPAMLSNKEFVLNSSAAQKIGDKNLYALNNGETPSSNTGSDEKLIAKLDELIQKTIGASNVTVSVSIDSSGNATSSDKSSSNGSQDNQKALSQKIKDTVVSILREEQRPGGVLSRR